MNTSIYVRYTQSTITWLHNDLGRALYILQALVLREDVIDSTMSFDIALIKRQESIQYEVSNLGSLLD
jgi:hypothetical protein